MRKNQIKTQNAISIVSIVVERKDSEPPSIRLLIGLELSLYRTQKTGRKKNYVSERRVFVFVFISIIEKMR